MGRKTLESLPGGKPLPNRINVVLTKNPPKDRDGSNINYTNSIEDIKWIADSFDHLETYIIGGGSVYKQFLSYCDTVLVTKIEGEFKADTHFPNLDELSEWEITEESEIIEENGYKFKYVTYSKAS